jgi:hypothetical protein
MYKVYLFKRTNQRLIIEIENTIKGFADRMKTLNENIKGIYGRFSTKVGECLWICRSVVVVGRRHQCKGWLSPILLQCVGMGIVADGSSGWQRFWISSWCRGWASLVRSVVIVVEGGRGKRYWPCWVEGEA